MSAATAVALGGLLVLAALLAAVERTPPDPRRLGLIASLAAVAAASRVLIPVPSAKPVTALCIVAGIALGPRAGAAVGAGAALLSNTFLGQGPWTPWQMLAWAACGASAGLLRDAGLRRRLPLAAFGLAWGAAYGVILDVYQLAAFGPAFTLGAFIATEARAVWFDAVHAATTCAVLWWAGPALLRLVDRYARRLDVRLVPLDPAPDPLPQGGAP